MKRLCLLFVAALSAACASQSGDARSARQGLEPRSDGLERPHVCNEQTLRELVLSHGSVRLMRFSRVEVPGRAVVGFEPFDCQDLARSACVQRAKHYAERRAWKLGLSVRILPVALEPTQVEIQYIEPHDRSHSVFAADVEYEVPWGSAAQRAALGALRDELELVGLELDGRSEREVALALATTRADDEAEVEGSAELAMPRIGAAPRQLGLRFRCKPDAGARARALSRP